MRNTVRVPGKRSIMRLVPVSHVRKDLPFRPIAGTGVDYTSGSTSAAHASRTS
jgi:hypothetical protein